MQSSHQETTVRIGPALAVPAILAKFGVNPADVLAAAEIDPQVFNSPDNLIPFRSRVHLLNVCAEKTECPHFGLLVGQKSRLASFGLIGYLAQHSPSVESALRSLIRHFHLHAQGSVVTLEVQGDLAFLGYGIYQRLNEPVDQLKDAGVAACYSVLSELCGNNWQPLEICLSHRKPWEEKPFREFFKVPLRFDEEQTGIYFPARWLKREVQIADPELHRILQEYVDQLESGNCEDFVEQVKRMVYAALPTQNIKADRIASLFSIHSRTLHRKLGACGISYLEIRDQCRYSAAKQMLKTTNLELIQIAAFLGYADTRAFNRAFKRWSGTTPTSWRKIEN